jgi:FtsH-binding integral membrane protein
MQSFNIFQSSSHQPTSKTLFDLSHLSPHVQQHLVKVYSTLAAMIGAAAVGAYIGVQYHLSLTLMSVMTFVTLFGLFFYPYQHGKEQNGRLAIALAFGFFKGATIAPLIEHTLYFNPHLLTLAFSATCIIFACFTAASLLSNRREYLYLGGFLASAISIMMWLSLFNLLIRSEAIPWIHLYGGLVIFSLYVLYDSQLIVERASMGNYDHIQHALDLFIDFAALFIRILIILNKNAQKKEEKKRRE